MASVVDVEQISSTQIKLTVSSLVNKLPYILTATNIADQEGTVITDSEVFVAKGGPRVESVLSLNATTIRITFNESMGNTGLTTPGNYVFTSPILAPITAAIVTKVSDTIVDVTIAGEMQTGTDNYTLVVSNVVNADGYTIPSEFDSGIFSGIGVAPQVASATIVDLTHVDVVFDSAVETTSAETIGNYAITGVSSPAVSVASKTAADTVRLTTILGIGGTHTVTVSNVTDAIGNVIDPAHDAATFTLVTDWAQQLPVAAPSGREGSISVFDSTRNLVVLFGGYDVGYDDETWEYDGLNWAHAVTAHAPTARAWHSMAFDSTRGVVVLFGGDAGGFRNAETWEYDGLDWIQIVPATTTPAARDNSAMTFDSDRGVCVLFGGRVGAGTDNAETWEWDGIDWSQKASGAVTKPSARGYHNITFDSSRNLSVLFGGNDTDETWEWNGLTWVQAVTVDSPPARSSHGIAFDTERNVSIIFGGALGAARKQDTWEYNGINWVVQTVAHKPTSRIYPTMAFDSNRNATVLFGGYDGAEDAETWEYGI